MFITFEGPEGSGKSSVLKIVSEHFSNEGKNVVTTREPGGVKISEDIRDIILNTNNTNMAPNTEALLYAAARSQHIEEVIKPALEKNSMVLCDRFIDSSLAYQGYARGIDIDGILKINKFAIGDMMPNLTIFFDVDPIIGLERISINKDREVNRLDLEGINFHKSVYNGYKKLVEMFPDRIKSVDASQDMQSVAADVIKVISKYDSF